MHLLLPKKLMALGILDILHRYSDENHCLSQRQIAQMLEEEYDLPVERKAIQRTIKDLIEFGDESGRFTIISSTAEKASDAKSGGRTVLSGLYLKPQFTDGELRLLIDGLLFSRHIPHQYGNDLIEKLKGLSNEYFRFRVQHIARLPADKEDNQELFLNIELLGEAISNRQKVTFQYLEYGTDKQLHVRKRPDGTVREYIINPYQIVARDWKYYLICNNDKYDSISNYRLDRIKDLKLLDEPAKPFYRLPGAKGQPLDLAAYMAEHVYMFSAENVRARFWVSRNLIGTVIDTFGKDVVFAKEDEAGTVATVTADEMSILQFAKTFSPHVILQTPGHLVERIKADIEKTAELYNKA